MMLPTTDFFGTQVTKVIIGDNPMTGHSYIQDRITGAEMADYYTQEKVVEALFTAVRAMARPNEVPPLIRLRGLDPARRYRVEQTGEVFGGDELMRVGLCCPFERGDAASLLYHIKAVDEA